MTEKQKRCFVIAPIGDLGSDVRKRSDQVLNHIIKPAAEECGYTTVRADQISEPGLITTQIIQHLVDDPLVVADLTNHNPNVFYELAVRHAIRKPVVQIMQEGQEIPFDIAQNRTIHFDHKDLDSVANCKKQLVKQIQASEQEPEYIDSPISVAIDLQSLRQSDDPLQQSYAQIMRLLQRLMARAELIQDTVERLDIAPLPDEEDIPF